MCDSKKKKVWKTQNFNQVDITALSHIYQNQINEAKNQMQQKSKQKSKRYTSNIRKMNTTQIIEMKKEESIEEMQINSLCIANLEKM